MIAIQDSPGVLNDKAKFKYQCTYCGCKQTMFPFENVDKKICHWCGHTIYKNKKIEFKDKLMQALRKANKNEIIY